MDNHPAPQMQMPPADLPASSLLNIATRKIAPFDEPYWISAIDGTALNPPMLVEGVNSLDEDHPTGGGIFISVWPARRRQHKMHGILVDPDATLTFTFHDPHVG